MRISLTYIKQIRKGNQYIFGITMLLYRILTGRNLEKAVNTSEYFSKVLKSNEYKESCRLPYLRVVDAVARIQDCTMKIGEGEADWI